jgi:hypothetical protein
MQVRGSSNVIRSIHVKYMIDMRTHISVYSISYINDNTNTGSESKHRMVFTAQMKFALGD